MFPRSRTSKRRPAVGGADEPEPLGGKDEHIDPMELLLASVGSCLTIGWVTHAHLAYESGRADWKQYATRPVMKMWMQLVHGAPYGAPPSLEVLRRDRQLSDNLAEGLIEALRPYFLRYVEPYRAYEIRKWDIFHRRQPRMDPMMLHEALGEAMGDQKNEILYPKRPNGGRRPVNVEVVLPGTEPPRAWQAGDRLERTRQHNPFVG